MTFLFFNDCLPDGRCIHEYSAALHESLIAYKELCQKQHELCIVTSARQDEVRLTEDISLLSCILGLEDRTERTYALRLFNKYPLGTFMDEDMVAEAVLSEEYGLCVEGQSRDATNLAIVSLCGGMLFTLGLCIDLRKDQLELKGNTSQMDVNNLYGETSNTWHIHRLLASIEYARLSNIDKVKSTIGGNVQILDYFISDFKRIAPNSQLSVIDTFKEARQQGRLYPVKADGKIIKDVTPDKSAKGRLYELRIFAPVALRVYFCHIDETVYLIDICGKSGNQTSDIKTAYKRIPQRAGL